MSKLKAGVVALGTAILLTRWGLLVLAVLGGVLLLWFEPPQAASTHAASEQMAIRRLRRER